MTNTVPKINKINNINNYILIGLLLVCLYKNFPNLDIGKTIPTPKLVTPFNFNIPAKLLSFFFNFIIGIIIFLIFMCKSRFFCKNYGIIDITNEKDIYYFENLRMNPLCKNLNKKLDRYNIGDICNSNKVNDSKDTHYTNDTEKIFRNKDNYKSQKYQEQPHKPEDNINEITTNEITTNEITTNEITTNEESTNEESTNEESTNEESTDEESTNEESTDEESTNEDSTK